ncbi:hypothetical protein ACTXQV_48050, partial [Klebsiella pneumoniae]
LLLPARMMVNKRPVLIYQTRLAPIRDTLMTKEKVLAPVVFQVLGQLYQNVPKDHKYRFYILLLTFFACTGRRFSELSLLPNQKIQIDKDSASYLEWKTLVARLK